MTDNEANTDNGNTFVEKIKAMLSQRHNVSVPQITLIETHISWVFLTGRLVYKIKKPVNLGFVDFSTLNQRHQFCLEELRLNKRLAPNLYRDVVAITDDQGAFRINGNGPIIDYVVRLHQFGAGMRFDQLLENHKLTPEHIKEVAKILAKFHHDIMASAHAIKPIKPLKHPTQGEPSTLHRATRENYQRCLPLLKTPDDIENINFLSHWSNTEFERIQAFLSTRQTTGFIRECHGDVHLGNIALYNQNVTLFDCIEFNADFRWIDVINEVSFLVMDLLSRNRQDYATLLLNTYLEITGDYQGLSSLRYYLVYRAMVRAKVELIRTNQNNTRDVHTDADTNVAGNFANNLADNARDKTIGDTINETNTQHTTSPYYRYINLALTLCQARQPLLIIMHGLSGSGKSTVAKRLQEKLFLVQIRSDVERKRLFLNNPVTAPTVEPGKGIYTPNASAQTYQHLYTLADHIIQASINVVVDAAFLRKADRQRFQQLAQKHNAQFAILNCHAEPTVLRDRIQARLKQGNAVSDATLEVLDHQLANKEPLADTEHGGTISINTLEPVDGNALLHALLNLAKTKSSDRKKSIDKKNTKHAVTD